MTLSHVMSRSVLSRMRSNTGVALEIELLMTCSTSAVAVWRSSASLVSLNSRVFSMAITAWSAKVLSSSTCEVLNSPASVRDTPIVPIALSPRSIGTTIRLRKPNAAAAAFTSAGMSDLGISLRMIGRPLAAARLWEFEDEESGAGKRARMALVAALVPAATPTTRSSSSTTRVTSPPVPPKRRLALSAIASNTGWTSDGELAISLRTSEVAACRSSASLLCSRAAFNCRFRPANSDATEPFCLRAADGSGFRGADLEAFGEPDLLTRGRRLPTAKARFPAFPLALAISSHPAPKLADPGTAANVAKGEMSKAAVGLKADTRLVPASRHGKGSRELRARAHFRTYALTWCQSRSVRLAVIVE